MHFGLELCLLKCQRMGENLWLLPTPPPDPGHNFSRSLVEPAFKYLFFLLLTSFPICSFCLCGFFVCLFLLLLCLLGIIFLEEKGLSPHIMRNWLWHVFLFLFQWSFPIRFLRVSLNSNRLPLVTPATPEPDLTKHFLKTRWLLFKDSECIPVLGSLKHTAECVLSLAWIITPAVTF